MYDLLVPHDKLPQSTIHISNIFQNICYQYNLRTKFKSTILQYRKKMKINIEKNMKSWMEKFFFMYLWSRNKYLHLWYSKHFVYNVMSLALLFIYFSSGIFFLFEKVYILNLTRIVFQSFCEKAILLMFDWKFHLTFPVM